MAQNNDDIADALSALAGGQVPPEPPHGSGAEHVESQATPPPAAKPRPANPAAPPRPAGPTPAPKSAVPARPAHPASNRPAAPPTPPAAPAAPAKVRPATPTARPATPVNPRQITPNLTPPPAPAEPEASEENEQPADPNAIYDDGDAVIVPAPNADVFKAKAKPTPKPRTHYTQTLEFKRTVIPILLTLGVIALVTAGVPFVSPANSALAALRDATGILIGLAVLGVLFLAFAAMNILQVKASLKI
jgi:hypothetical protein